MLAHLDAYRLGRLGRPRTSCSRSSSSARGASRSNGRTGSRMDSGRRAGTWTSASRPTAGTRSACAGKTLGDRVSVGGGTTGSGAATGAGDGRGSLDGRGLLPSGCLRRAPARSGTGASGAAASGGSALGAAARPRRAPPGSSRGRCSSASTSFFRASTIGGRRVEAPVDEFGHVALAHEPDRSPCVRMIFSRCSGVTEAPSAGASIPSIFEASSPAFTSGCSSMKVIRLPMLSPKTWPGHAELALDRADVRDALRALLEYREVLPAQPAPELVRRVEGKAQLALVGPLDRHQDLAPGHRLKGLAVKARGSTALTTVAARWRAGSAVASSRLSKAGADWPSATARLHGVARDLLHLLEPLRSRPRDRGRSRSGSGTPRTASGSARGVVLLHDLVVAVVVRRPQELPGHPAFVDHQEIPLRRLDLDRPRVEKGGEDVARSRGATAASSVSKGMPSGTRHRSARRGASGRPRAACARRRRRSGPACRGRSGRSQRARSSAPRSGLSSPAR